LELNLLNIRLQLGHFHHAIHFHRIVGVLIERHAFSHKETWLGLATLSKNLRQIISYFLLVGPRLCRDRAAHTLVQWHVRLGCCGTKAIIYAISWVAVLPLQAYI